MADPAAVPPTLTSTEVRRTRIAVVIALALGTVLLATTINNEGRTAAFVGTGILLASVWIGGFVAARRWRRSDRTHLVPRVAAGIAIGVAAFTAFVVLGWISRRLDILDRSIDEILETADAQPKWAVLLLAAVNGVAEELFFRGTLIDAVPRRHAITFATAVYVVVTFAGGNVALVLAAAAMGALFAALRLATGSLATPIAAHLTWSLLVIVAFPRP